MLLVLNCRRVIPLYREVDAQPLSESRPAHNSVRLGLLTILALQYKLHTNAGLSLRTLIRLWALGLHEASPSIFMGFRYNELLMG